MIKRTEADLVTVSLGLLDGVLVVLIALLAICLVRFFSAPSSDDLVARNLSRANASQINVKIPDPAMIEHDLTLID